MRDPTGRAAIAGVFDQPWPDSAVTRHGAKSSKADRKRDKKARGRARG